MTRIVYIGQFTGGVEIADTGQLVLPGESVDVPAEIAGRPPSGDPADEDYDPGEGLLAQPANWSSPKTKAAKQAKERAVEPPAEASDTNEEQPNG